MMFSRLVKMLMMAVLCSTAMAVEMPEVSFYLRGTEEESLMKEVNEAIRATHCRQRCYTHRTHLAVFVKQFFDEDAAFWARQMNEYDSMSTDRKLETEYSMSL